MDIEKTSPVNNPVVAIISWKTASSEEKIERCRRIIKSQQESIDFLRTMVDRLETNMRRHRHSESGEVMVSISEVGYLPTVFGGLDRKVTTDEDYF